MTAVDQLQMFEPEGSQLASLCNMHLRQFRQFSSIADNLEFCGASSASLANYWIADSHLKKALICDSALQFEKLAGLL